MIPKITINKIDASANQVDPIAQASRIEALSLIPQHFKTSTFQYTIMIAGIVCCLLLFSCNERDQSIDADIKVPVSVMDLKPQSIERFIKTTGTVYPTQEVYLKSQFTGAYFLQTNPATRKPFALGDRVRKGQVIVKIEDKEFENNTKIESQRLNLEVTKNNLEKQKSLHEKGGVTFRELKNAEIEYINAKYAYDNAALQLEKMVIKAPFDGIIVELPYFTAGVKVDANVQMVKVMNYSKLLMDIKLPEKHLAEVKTGQQVRVMNYTISKDTLTGRISQISPVISPETRTFQGVLEIDNPNMVMRPGMFVKAELVVEKRENTIVIPKEVIISKQQGMVVFVVENGSAVEKNIATGLENPDHIEVVKGLDMNQRLVITGFETLRNNSKVSVVR
ncbi:efflux RND transporter periplasmic adaptor subunit [Fulvivirgaceae bacterium BMA10]|uniref:Efflux RND transporter periplasmic adaptor subunit n=1 Tax=Splendidivirga corallicola TaxID=3051826 RepID=A0ABT8KQ73_9BACT|nr:efflux RND transporter periplasmic adaptor subunit [Fulvivirgaceae bacterium BMA10]